MTDRTIESLKQAVSFARGDCKHDWEPSPTASKTCWVKTCKKCGVRITSFSDGEPLDRKEG